MKDNIQNITQEQLDALETQQQPMPIVQPIVPSEILALELKDFENTLIDLEHKLKGEVKKIENKQEVWDAVEKPWMNGHGVSTVIGMIRSLVDTNTFLTILTDSDINQIMMEVSNEITTILSNKCNDFKIDLTKLGWIQLMVENIIFMALKRAQGGTTLRQIHSMTSRIENPLQIEAMRQREKKSFFGKFF